MAPEKTNKKDYLFEAKMLIVGEPGAGKTSLAWKMENANCDLPKAEETTKGIEVKQYYFPLQPEDVQACKHPAKLANRQFRLNLWDFGGQEIYKATHRFFLSKRALYALVADSRNEDTDFNYWLHIVELFGGDSPLLIVLNEKHQRKRNLDTVAMRKRFTNIAEVLDVDFADPDQTRLRKLARAIKYYAAQLPHVGSPVPAKWTVVREALERDPRNTITLPEYLALCKANGIAAMQDALVLSQYFHDIGVFLHFQEDDLLDKTLFLKPNWATTAVYKILDHPRAEL
jgi:internalin A